LMAQMAKADCLNSFLGIADNALVSAYLEGNDYAFQILVNRYQDKLVNYLNSLIRDHEAAVDLAQEAFIRVFRNAYRYRGDYQFSTWIYRIATNLAIDEMRRRERKGRFFLGNVISLFRDDGKPVPLPDFSQSPEVRLDRKEKLACLQKAIDALPEIYRVAFILKEVEELSYEEIAAVLEVSMGTVKSRIHRAKLLLRETLSEVL
jgi:RNA polymerase sigma-70 factor, ECF subfamily